MTPNPGPTPRANPLRVGLVGCGFIAEYHAAAYRQNPHADLMAVCDVDLARARQFGERHGARAWPDLATLLANAEVDLVDVCTPQHAHVEPTLAAIAAGKSVFVEKPLSLNLAEAETMVRAAAERGVWLATNFNRRFSQPYQMAKARQQAGQLGDFAYLTLKIASTIDREPTDRHHLAYDLLIHLADLARWFGGAVTRVSAQFAARPGWRAYSNLAVALAFAGGGVGTLIASLDSTRLHPIESAEICGLRGHAQVHNCVGGIDFFPHETAEASSWRPQPFGGQHHLLQFYPTTIVAHIDALVEALVADQPPPIAGADGVAALRLVLAAIEAAETGRAIDPLTIHAR